ncbi:hypothetical protein IMG5_168660 [Ichthyophthirius multifiliis]|uniref:Uncharacterized protein n=1 Tax=Ichthyophthirius multifiliis TaxID=5932 RepID=G0R163_ICHMU|nr:hypothetical protein IMG5_168660 [Ichthyophthirius multifiliis]EGR28830.1 hypothetical protein IMG5_168660 [Ichthyophthirius multifiliis]|eukprot:XP_004030066.1 hypothetical protein IMG5_168660 [Ichthyophthirius multifiliis]
MQQAILQKSFLKTAFIGTSEWQDFNQKAQQSLKCSRLQEIRQQEREISKQISNDVKAQSQKMKEQEDREQKYQEYLRLKQLKQSLEEERQKQEEELGKAHKEAQEMEEIMLIEQQLKAEKQQIWTQNQKIRTQQAKERQKIEKYDLIYKEKEDFQRKKEIKEKIEAEERKKAKKYKEKRGEKNEEEDPLQYTETENKKNYLKNIDFSKTYFHNPIVIKQEDKENAIENAIKEYERTQQENMEKLLKRKTSKEKNQERHKEALEKEKQKKLLEDFVQTQQKIKQQEIKDRKIGQKKALLVFKMKFLRKIKSKKNSKKNFLDQMLHGLMKKFLKKTQKYKILRKKQQKRLKKNRKMLKFIENHHQIVILQNVLLKRKKFRMAIIRMKSKMIKIVQKNQRNKQNSFLWKKKMKQKKKRINKLKKVIFYMKHQKKRTKIQKIKKKFIKIVKIELIQRNIYKNKKNIFKIWKKKEKIFNFNSNRVFLVIVLRKKTRKQFIQIILIKLKKQINYWMNFWEQITIIWGVKTSITLMKIKQMKIIIKIYMIIIKKKSSLQVKGEKIVMKINFLRKTKAILLKKCQIIILFRKKNSKNKDKINFSNNCLQVLNQVILFQKWKEQYFCQKFIFIFLLVLRQEIIFKKI